MLLQKQQPKMFEGINGGEYFLINTIPLWNEFYAEMREQMAVACDTETTGRDYLIHKIVGLSFSWGVKKNFYIPIRHETGEKQLDIEQIRSDLEEFFFDPDRITIWHNYKFDGHFLRNEELEPKGIVHDTFLMHKLIDENGSAKLKDISVKEIHPNANKWEKELEVYRTKKGRTRVPHPTIEGKRIYLKKENVHYGMVPLDIMVPYASSDGHYTWLLWSKKRNQIVGNQALKELYILEIALLKTVLNMEHSGAYISKDYLSKLGPKLEKDINRLDQKVKEQLNVKDINIGSNLQLVPALQAIGIQFSKKTPSGRFSLDDEVLEYLATKYKVCSDIREYRGLCKLKGTYIKNIVKKLSIDGYLHCEYNQMVRTGRMSSKRPNLTNIPAKTDLIRRAFIVPEDFIMVLLDYSQIEVRLTAHYSLDEVLLDVYNNTFEDVHLRTACEMFGYNYQRANVILHDENHPLHKEIKFNRKVAKQINFLIIYGGGATLLSQKISTPAKQYTRTVCKKFIDSYMERFAGVRKWMIREKAKAMQCTVVQNYFGRYRRFPELENASQRMHIDSQREKIVKAQRQWVNFLIQGSAADLFKKTMVRLNRLLANKRSRLVMPIHDELIFYIARDELSILKEIKFIMEDWDFKVPIKADICYTSTSWADKKEYK